MKLLLDDAFIGVFNEKKIMWNTAFDFRSRAIGYNRLAVEVLLSKRTRRIFNHYYFCHVL